MKAVILYKPNTERETSVLEYVREFAHVTGHGIEIAKLYDIMQFPAIVVFKDDGEYIRSWLERDSWPTISELSFYK